MHNSNDLMNEFQEKPMFLFLLTFTVFNVLSFTQHPGKINGNN